MSYEAVRWAMRDSPVLLTEKGRPDSTARHVLAVLAEHAHKDGSNSYPSVDLISYCTGYDRRTVQRALRRLEDGRLIRKTGEVSGCRVWALDLRRKRPASDWEAVKADEEAERAAAAERKRRSRAKTVAHSASVTVTDTECVTEGNVTHSASGRHASRVRDVTHSASGRHALSAARTIKEPPQEPPENQSVVELEDNSSGSSQLEASQPEGPSERHAYGIPDAARPLVDALTAAGITVRWPFKGDQWFPVLALIQKTGVPAMVSHAVRMVGRTPDVDSARYFMRGWAELPPLPAPGAKPIQGAFLMPLEGGGEAAPDRRRPGSGWKPYTNPTDPAVYENGW
ncbi:helix-turn-helix domain-containing protein [Streptomyces actuosus]|uniref:Helix-turn-helix domain-containing protein n=1 Tax=Streptomyces actuosus TaxID=1885 RepID=A0ABS2VJ40_STRAS|nr:helix-turn-helix domain-containing protein [Streptomyces actuosus]MBN0043095.1 helix-turn-helix domain-containing protein [Streptomyces actuosus]